MDKKPFLTFLLDAFKIFSFFLFLLSLLPFRIPILGSEWLFMYLLCIGGFILGILGNLQTAKNRLVDKIGKVAVLGNLLMVILFFPPFYVYWGMLLESLISKLSWNIYLWKIDPLQRNFDLCYTFTCMKTNPVWRRTQEAEGG